MDAGEKTHKNIKVADSFFSHSVANSFGYWKRQQSQSFTEPYSKIRERLSDTWCKLCQYQAGWQERDWHQPLDALAVIRL